MTIYTVRQVQAVLQVGRDTAYEIIRHYGFQIGYRPKSPFRITETQLNKYISERTNKK